MVIMRRIKVVEGCYWMQTTQGGGSTRPSRGHNVADMLTHHTWEGSRRLSPRKRLVTYHAWHIDSRYSSVGVIATSRSAYSKLSYWKLAVCISLSRLLLWPLKKIFIC